LLSRSFVERFFELPARAHARDPEWIHPEFGVQRRLLDGSSVFRRSADAAAWIAGDVAEAAAFRDERYGRSGLVGLVHWLPGAMRKLGSVLEDAERWLAERGATEVRLPIAGHVLYGFGFLAEGFDRAPVVGATWSRPDALDAMRILGYEPARRFLNYELSLDENAVRLARATPPPDGIRFGRITRTRARSGLLTLAELRNRTFVGLWGDAAMSSDEAWELLRRMRPVLVPDFALIAFDGHAPVGFVLCFPDFNQAFAGVRAEPRGVRAARALVLHRGRIDRGALGEVGVASTHRGRGIAAALVARVIEAMACRRYRTLHYMLVLEENAASRRTIERFGGRVVSSHVVFSKRL
jgi:ribosomal protein S18 acetylase RimI-like enzyme